MNTLPARLLLIDDLRSPLRETIALYDEVVIARTSAEAIEILSSPGGMSWTNVMFDHDLGGEDDIRPVIRHIEEQTRLGNPLRVTVSLAHSDNPVGKKWIVDSMRSIGVPCVSLTNTDRADLLTYEDPH